MAESSSNFDEMKVTDLREELKKRGLPTKGTKAELVSRLESEDGASDSKEDEQVEEEEKPVVKKQKVTEQKALDSFFKSTKPAPKKSSKEEDEDDTSAAKTATADIKETDPNEKVVIEGTEGTIVDSLKDATWRKALAPEFKKPYFKKILEFLEGEKKRGAEIFPPEDEIFNAFNYTPLSSIKCVILGQDPYHDNNQAHGLCFSVKKGITPPPSLKNMYKELETDVPGFKAPSHGNLEAWAKNGVFLLNATLTVQAHKANSHAACGWQMFTDAVIKVINEKQSGVVFILWGGFAQKKGKIINRHRHHVLEAAHPSPLSVTKFRGCKVFSKTNALLEKDGKDPIDWKLPQKI